MIIRVEAHKDGIYLRVGADIVRLSPEDEKNLRRDLRRAWLARNLGKVKAP